MTTKVFNFNPVGFTLQAAGTAYTIPSGKYANVSACPKGAGEFHVSGSTFCAGDTTQVLSDSLLNAQTITSLALPVTGYQLIVGNTAIGITSTSDFLSAFSKETQNLGNVVDVWLPSGVVVAGTSGCNLAISLYTS